MSGKVLMQKEKYNGFDPKLSEPGKTIWIRVRPLWLFSQTPCIHLGIPRGGGGGFKINNFFSYLNFVTANPNIAFTDPEGGGIGKGPGPPGKTQVIWDSIGNKQLDLSLEKLYPPPPLEKMLKPLWNLGKLYKPLAFCKIRG